MKKLFRFFVTSLLFSCGLQTTTLTDGRYKAATNPKVYSNRLNFNKSLLQAVDTSVIYEEYNIVSYIDNKPEPVNVNLLARLNYYNRDTHYAVYRFYSNGCFNLFFLNKNEPTLSKSMFDPIYTGWSGVYYKADNKIKGDLITQISGIGTIGKVEKTFEFIGDTLFVHMKGRRDNVFLKRQVPNELISHNANW